MSVVEDIKEDVSKLSVGHWENQMKRQDYLFSVAKEIDKFSDSQWNKLSISTQEWFNAAAAAIDAQQTIPDFENPETEQAVQKLQNEGQAPTEAVKLDLKKLPKRLPPSLKIKLLVKSNPKRGAKSKARFAIYKDGMTIEEYVNAGGAREDIRWDLEKGFITLEGL